MKTLLEALRHLAADATLDPTDRLLAAERQIKGYAVRAGNPRWRVLEDLDSEVEAEMLTGLEKNNAFWKAVREYIAHLVNQSLDQDKIRKDA